MAACVLNDHALQSQAQPQGRNRILAGIAKSAHFAFDATDTKASRNTDPVHVGQCLFGASWSLTLIARDPLELNSSLVSKPAGANSLTHREIRIGQVNVLTHHRDGHCVTGVVNSVQQVFPTVPDHLARLKT